MLLTRLAQWNLLVSKFQTAPGHTAKAGKSWEYQAVIKVFI